MHPKFAGDTHDITKLSIMNWLAPGETWLMHPMYYALEGEVRDMGFPQRISHALRTRLVTGDIQQRPLLTGAVANDSGHLFMDPDTGVLLDNARVMRSQNHRHVHPINAYLRVAEIAAVARQPARARQLTLVYDASFDNNPNHRDADNEIKGRAGQQLRKKLRRIHEQEGQPVYAAAYITHNQSVAFMWASTDRQLVTDATRLIMATSRLPDCCFVDDGTGHAAPQP